MMRDQGLDAIVVTNKITKHIGLNNREWLCTGCSAIASSTDGR